MVQECNQEEEKMEKSDVTDFLYATTLHGEEENKEEWEHESSKEAKYINTLKGSKKVWYHEEFGNCAWEQAIQLWNKYIHYNILKWCIHILFMTLKCM